MYGALASGLVSIGGSVLSYFMQPKTPTYDTKSAGKYIKSYQKNVSSLWGDVPQVDFNYSANDMYNAATGAFSYNSANLENYGNMATSIYQTDVKNKIAAEQQINPNLFRERDLAAANAEAYLKGEVPQDVQRSLARTGAYKAGASGTGAASGISTARNARDLGLTSLDLTAKGSQMSLDWAAQLNNMLPVQTSVADILKNSGISSNTAIQTSFQTAVNKLTADTTNAQNQIVGKSALTDMYGRVLTEQGDVLANKYNSQIGVAANQSQNLNNMFSGITSGMGSMTGGRGGTKSGQSSWGGLFGA